MERTLEPSLIWVVDPEYFDDPLSFDVRSEEKWKNLCDVLDEAKTMRVRIAATITNSEDRCGRPLNDDACVGGIRRWEKLILDYEPIVGDNKNTSAIAMSHAVAGRYEGCPGLMSHLLMDVKKGVVLLTGAYAKALPVADLIKDGKKLPEGYCIRSGREILDRDGNVVYGIGGPITSQIYHISVSNQYLGTDLEMVIDTNLTLVEGTLPKRSFLHVKRECGMGGNPLVYSSGRKIFHRNLATAEKAYTIFGPTPKP